MKIRRATLLAGLAWGVAVAVSGVALGQPPIFGADLQGRPVRRLLGSRDQAAVLFFLATDCPISNRYAPEIQRLRAEFAGKPVAFWLVYPNATETAEGVVRHQADFGLRGATLVRPSAALLALARPTVTPEAVLVLPDSGRAGATVVYHVVYRGRIDNRYVDIGKERPRATRHDLEDAIIAVLAHRPVAPPGGPPVGCGVVSESALGMR